MALHLPIEPLKHVLGWNWYPDANPESTSLIANGLANAPLKPVKLYNKYVRKVDSSRI